MAGLDFILPDGLPLVPQKQISLSAENASLKACVKSLEMQLESLKAGQEVAVKLKEVEVKIDFQPKLKEAYDEGYAACRRAMQEARDFMRG